jgi:Flp pilus assembly protein protease CpaA
MFEIFLILLAGVWLAFATACDFRKREIPDWVSFSLIAFSLAYRAFVSILGWQDFFTPGIVGLAIFFVIGEGIYRIGFGGGDAKLLMALGTILPFSFKFWANINLLAIFFITLFFIGAFYGLVFSMVIAVRNRKKFYEKFKYELRSRGKLLAGFIAVSVVFLAFSLFNLIFIAFFIFFLLAPLIFVYSKALEEVMVKTLSASKLTLGDWLYENVKVGNRVVIPSITGLGEKELKILQKYRGKVKVKEGIPFTISFLIAFAFIVALWYSNWSLFNYNFGF